jgi:hypothetical protein
MESEGRSSSAHPVKVRGLRHEMERLGCESEFVEEQRLEGLVLMQLCGKTFASAPLDIGNSRLNDRVSVEDLGPGLQISGSGVDASGFVIRRRLTKEN